MDRRALPGFLTGLAGCACAVAGATLESPPLMVAAAGCSIVAGTWSLAMIDYVRRAEGRLAVADTEIESLHAVQAATVAHNTSIVDVETALPDARFFEVALANRVAAARRHLWPVAVVLVDFTPNPGHPLAAALFNFAGLIRDTLREADVVCRVSHRTFALVLEDTNEAGGVWAAERLQAAVAQDVHGARRVAAGIASYPTHGLEPGDVLDRARHALARAMATNPGHSLGAVEVATFDPASG